MPAQAPANQIKPRELVPYSVQHQNVGDFKQEMSITVSTVSHTRLIILQ